MHIIDTHLHVWNLQRLPYHWLTPDQPALYRNVLPDEIYPQMQAAGVVAAVLVEAANLTAEIPYLLELKAQNRWIAGVVGWMSADDDLSQPQAGLSGVRIPAVTQAKPVSLPEVVAQHGLSCDLIVEADAYTQAEALIRQHPGIRFVLNHFAGAWLTPGGEMAWQTAVKSLAALPNTVMKLSGYLTSAKPAPIQPDTLREYVESAAALFGAHRLMYGSNYPICTLAGSYAEDVALIRQAVAALPVDAQALILHGTAARVYRLTGSLAIKY